MSDPEPDNDDLHKLMAPLMEAIGHVAHHWARLEYEINQAIWELAAVSPEDGACITAQIQSIVARMRALVSLCDRYGCGKRLIKDLNTFSAEADKLARRRNRVVHDPWFYREVPTGEAIRIEYGRLEVSADRKLVYEVKPQSRKEVLEVAHAIVAKYKEFTSLRERIDAETKERRESRRGKETEDSPGSPVPDSEPQ